MLNSRKTDNVLTRYGSHLNEKLAFLIGKAGTFESR
jgi:hypothetical protein